MIVGAITRATCVAALVAATLSADIVLPSGTRINIRLDQTLSSATAEQGQPVQLSVTEAVHVNDVVVIPQGANVLGTVVVAQEKRNMGRTGKLDFSIDKVRTTGGEYIPLRYTMQKREGGSKGVSTGVITAGVAVVFWPAAPFVLLRKGKDVTINRGMAFEVFTDQDYTLRASQSPVMQSYNAPAAPAIAAANPNTLQYASATQALAPPAGVASVNVTSDLQGAEVEVDGAFVGSTPSTLRMAPGLHKITVRHGRSVWSRDLNVQPGGSVNVNAILKQ